MLTGCATVAVDCGITASAGTGGGGPVGCCWVVGEGCSVTVCCELTGVGGGIRSKRWRYHSVEYGLGHALALYDDPYISRHTGRFQRTVSRLFRIVLGIEGYTTLLSN